MNLLKVAIIIAVILLFWKMFYYKYYYSKWKPILVFVVGIPLVLYGFYEFFFVKNIFFRNIKIIYFISILFLIIAFSFILLATRKHKLTNKIDITLDWVNKNFGKFFIYVCMVLAFPAFLFMIVATFKLFGEEHIFLWLMIFLAWTRSNYKLYKNFVTK